MSYNPTHKLNKFNDHEVIDVGNIGHKYDHIDCIRKQDSKNQQHFIKVTLNCHSTIAS